MKRLYILKFCFKSILYMIMLLAYINNINSLDFVNQPYSFLLISFYIILSLSFILQWFPNRFLLMASKKQFKRAYINNEVDKGELIKNNVKTSNRFVSLVMVIWIMGNLFLFYFLNKIKLLTPSMCLLVSSFYYLGDLICVLIFCPIQKFILKNKCCSTCRMYNYGNIMITTPLLVYQSFYSYSLVLMSFITWIFYEIRFYKSPSRFFEVTNDALKCTNCSDKLCELKKQIHRDKRRKNDY